MLLAEFGVKRPVTNLMIFLGLIVLGVMSIIFLSIDLMPEMEIPAITVMTAYRGAAAEDVETAVTKHIENDLSIVSNLTEINSYSREGMSAVVCRFNWGANLDEAANEIRDRLGFTEMKLPDDAEKPIIVKFSTTAMPILAWGVTAKESWENLYEILDEELTVSLKQIEGVGAVQLIGGLQRQINIEVDKAKLAAYGVSINEVENAIRTHNYSLPAGSLKVGPNEYMLQTPGEYKRVDEIGQTVIKLVAAAPVRLKDVATVSDDFQEPPGLVYVNGTPGLLVFIQKQSGSNTNEVVAKVYDRLESIKKRLPADIKMMEMFNTADFINLTLNNLTSTVIFGGILVIIITLIFLGEIRSSLIITLTIPFSLIVSFTFLYVWGKTINMMSLASIAIAIGMVVDNAIVILENIFSHRGRGKDQYQAAIVGASEVGLAVSASALTTIVVFVPLIFLKGIVGIMFKELGVMIIVTILASLMTALTFTPMLASRFLTFSKDVFSRKPRWYLALENTYRAVLGWALRHKFQTVVLSILVLALSLSVIPLMGTEFFPEEDTGDLRVTVELPPGKRMEEAVKISQDVEKVFHEVCGKDLANIYTRTGTVGLGGAIMGMKEGSNVVMIGAKLVKVGQRRRSDKQIAQEIRSKLAKLPGIVKMDVKTGDPMAQAMTSSGKALSVDVYGNNMDDTDKIAAQIKYIMDHTEGAKDAAISRDIAKPEWKFIIDPDKASSLGLTKNYIASTLRTYFYGKTVSKYREGGYEYDIFVRLRPEDRQYMENITDSFISAPGTGLNIPISNVAKISEELGPIEIERKNQVRVARVEANLYQRSLGEVSSDIEKAVNKLALPEGVNLKIGGLIKEQKKSFRDLGLLMILSVFLVYAVMASQFESLLDPFIIIFAVPFGFSGVFISLFMRGYPISMVSLLGAVLLIGVVVNNAIVLVDYINLLRRPVAEGGYGMELMEAIMQTGVRRLRPILMTTLTTVFGLLPMAIQTGEGTEGWRPLGTTILGGLIFSTLVTLVLVPVLYAIFNKDKKISASAEWHILKG
ncbi:MAG: efflux RND transporter permease subunit [Planctomycetes bacterium]|nr:efflux RND transporter permease subunit [Planctomycetota bacterium]